MAAQTAETYLRDREQPFVTRQPLVKRYVVSQEVADRVLPMFRSMLQTFNAKKIGRNRRGTLKLDGITAQMDQRGLWHVEVTMNQGRSRFMRMFPGNRKFSMYRLTDFRKLFRLLASNDLSE